MNFAQWLELDEVATTTSAIAGFSRIALPLRRRGEFFLTPEELENFEKRKRRKNKHMKEGLRVFNPEPEFNVMHPPAAPERKRLRIHDPDTPRLRLVTGPSKQVLNCPMCGEPTAMKQITRPEFDEDGNLVGGMCHRCLMKSFMSH